MQRTLLTLALIATASVSYAQTPRPPTSPAIRTVARSLAAMTGCASPATFPVCLMPAGAPAGDGARSDGCASDDADAQSRRDRAKRRSRTNLASATTAKATVSTPAATSSRRRPASRASDVIESGYREVD